MQKQDLNSIVTQPFNMNITHGSSVTNHTLESRCYDYYVDIIAKTVSCLTLTFGVPGNVFILLTVSRMAVRPTALYLGFLAVSDVMVLGLSYFDIFDILYFLNMSVRYCFAFYFSLMTFRTFSDWILIFLCVERFVSLRFPLQKHRLFTKRTVLLSIGLAFSIPASISTLFFSLFTFSSQDFKIVSMYNDLIMLFYIVLPGALITIFAILSTFQLKKKSQLRNALFPERRFQKSVAMETQLTRLMYVTVACFLFFTLPWTFLGFYQRIREIRPLRMENDCVYKFVYSFWVLLFINNSINFYAYCACAKGFRKNFIRVISCKKISRII